MQVSGFEGDLTSLDLELVECISVSPNESCIAPKKRHCTLHSNELFLCCVVSLWVPRTHGSGVHHHAAGIRKTASLRGKPCPPGRSFHHPQPTWAESDVYVGFIKPLFILDGETETSCGGCDASFDRHDRESESEMAGPKTDWVRFYYRASSSTHLRPAPAAPPGVFPLRPRVARQDPVLGPWIAAQLFGHAPGSGRRGDPVGDPPG